MQNTKDKETLLSQSCKPNSEAEKSAKHEKIPLFPKERSNFHLWAEAMRGTYSQSDDIDDINEE